MKKKGKRKRLKLKKEKVAIVVVIIFVVLMIALYLIQQSTRKTEPKEPAEEYFRIFDTTVNDADPVTNDTAIERWIIYSISFKIQAIGGDAHNVVVKSWARAPHEGIGNIPEGEYRYVEQTSVRPFGYMSEINEDGKVPMEITITSTEAEGTVTIYL